VERVRLSAPVAVVGHHGTVTEVRARTQIGEVASVGVNRGQAHAMPPKPKTKPRTTRKPLGRPRKRRDAEGATVTTFTPEEQEQADAQLGRVEVRRALSELLSRGKSPGLAVEEIARQFGLTERHVWRYKQAISERWAEIDKDAAPFERARLLRILEDLLLECREAKDRKNAIAAAGKIMDLLGLKLTKVEVGTGGLDAVIAAIKATPATRLDELAELERRAREAASAPSEPTGGADAG